MLMDRCLGRSLLTGSAERFLGSLPVPPKPSPAPAHPCWVVSKAERRGLSSPGGVGAGEKFTLAQDQIRR